MVKNLNAVNVNATAQNNNIVPGATKSVNSPITP